MVGIVGSPLRGARRTGEDHLGIYPPLTFTSEEIDRVLTVIGAVLEELA